MSDGKKLVQFFDHGLGDCVQYVTLLQLYKRRGYDVRCHWEPNKEHVFQAAGIGHQQTLKHNPWKYYPGFNSPKPEQDGSGNKTFLNLNRDGLPHIGEPDELWDELCQVNLEDSFDKLITPEVRAEVDRFLDGLPRPIVCIHSKGTNFQGEKTIPDKAISEVYSLLLDGMPGSLVLMDWDNRVPRPPHGRIRHVKRDWGHISVLQTAALLSASDLLIGIDSGPYHLAAMTRTPALGVFHHFYPSCVTLPRPTLKNVVMTRNANSYKPVNQARRKRWSVVEYGGALPSASDIATHALRMLTGPRYGLPLGRDVMLQQMVRDWLKASTGTSALADRNNTMDWLFRELGRFPNPQIVETGSIRSREDWSAGYSTYLFGCYLDGRNAGQLTSTDVDGGNCATARELCRPWGERVSVVESDSVQFLKGYGGKIDVLFLDSMDCEHAEHASHGLAEAKAAEPHFHDGSIVGFDDTVWQSGRWTGKGGLGVPYLLGQGWKVAASGYQTFLVIGPGKT
ncbi:hypothetical protein GobsT_18660 [Gemmata obscuriglobus]|uniref:Uncharacterized protein n=1 Tax=Gemmata obscuriglobus TaxID=114 RepID=A0A2Z3H622_9BACT|nr:class I SAM-dependent methyltransferase [Gemmata obscuriglobus]AWM39772.1 hypothetical protein C1280_24055 [Gemmata obscuriglobus]QEG27113.1 hypothetical protein GobsT_18660 [Gemmata obscuriglobus]VTS03634.1 hypothetical protein : Uncharacterized protein OS=Criblamydia sequanensis GN=CSEC_0298 PE=4 SV=1: Glyco_transf_9: Methyltransf_24 [Gemmata obscuriglobus UQM 2246]